MKDRKLQTKNNINIFLNEYFSAIILIIAVIIFLFSYIFFISPKLKTTKDAIKSNIVVQKQLYAQQENKLNELKLINSVYSKILPSDLEKFNKVLPSDYIKESLYGEMEEIITREGYLLSAVTITGNEEEKKEEEESQSSEDGELAVKRDSNIGEIIFTLEVGAIDYRGLKKIINNLEASSRLYDVEIVSFSDEELTASFTISTYYYKELVKI